jgi:hypothetical protein
MRVEVGVGSGVGCNNGALLNEDDIAIITGWNVGYVTGNLSS